MAQLCAFQLYLLIFFWEMLCSTVLQGFPDSALVHRQGKKKLEVKIVVTS